MSTLGSIIVAALGALDIATLIIFFVNRHDQKKSLEEKLKTLEKDGLRTQLLLLIMFKPDDEREILTLGEKYFAKLDGDWYATPIFNQWCEERKLNPEWFDKDK